MLHVTYRPQRTVGFALERLLTLSTDVRFVLLSTLDSSSDLRHSPHLAKYICQGLRFIDGQPYADVRVIAAMLEDRSLFTGFDEAWLLPCPPSVPLPPRFGVTTDAEQIADPGGVEAWMRATGTRIGLGDGVGLRILSLDPQPADILAEPL